MITECDNTMGRPTANTEKHNYAETVMAHAGYDSIILPHYFYHSQADKRSQIFSS